MTFIKHAKSFITSVFVFVSLTMCSDMTESSFGKFNHGVLAAFGDFNSDELTDAFVVTNKSNLQIYLAYDKEPFLRPSPYMCNFTEFVITSVVPGDFDGDAIMDVLFTTVGSKGLQETRIVWGGIPYLNCTDADTVKVHTIGQPLVMDYNHDMILDLFGINKKGERYFWLFNHTRARPIEVPIGNDIYKEVKLPHSHTFLDINDDNAADLLISTKFDVEIWLGGIPPGFVYSNSIQLPIGVENQIFGQALFLDVALSGHFYLILPVCYDSECHNSTLLIYDDENWRDLKVNFNDGRGTTWRLVPPRNETYFDTITMRSGDYNMDGYPDILLTLSPDNSNDTHVFLLHNVQCEFEECQFRRTYEVHWEQFVFGKNVVLAAFYDFHMDGVLDIIYMKKNMSTDTYTMNAFKNELEYDTNFIKVIVVTGLVNEHAPELFGGLHKKRGTYGTNLPGPKISYETYSQEGSRTGVCAQLSQSAYFALQLPYSIFGLDRTPNFVETLKVGISGYSKSWTQIIPNSQIVVIPYPLDDSSQWKAQLFVTPSKLVLNSVFVLTAIVIIISICILVLHWRERNDRQDIIEIDEKTYVKI